ncbi:type IV pilus modification protein PilV [Pseudomonas sp. HUK17]|uniref:type IV pilus modification protein PilV n=1 Tax=Pseudomonas sp. HUK17 TaxID=1799359 RepID=UPI0007928787|nr:type IV pilus modification protein PilV [Pseudomonas sp. HUK17]KXJ32824.1 type IV pilus modification protein PilV [Pseudomonas sp. HUK17]
MNRPRRQRGATLIEVLVAMFILAIGLLGLAGLQAMSVQSNQGAYYRSQATILANDIADRMRANRKAALAGDYAQSSPPSTSSTPSSTSTPAQRDLAEWNSHLASSLPQGTGTIVTSSNIVTISISWNDARARIKSTDETTQQATARALETFEYRTRL